MYAPMYGGKYILAPKKVMSEYIFYMKKRKTFIW